MLHEASYGSERQYMSHRKQTEHLIQQLGLLEEENNSLHKSRQDLSHQFSQIIEEKEKEVSTLKNQLEDALKSLNNHDKQILIQEKENISYKEENKNLLSSIKNNTPMQLNNDQEKDQKIEELDAKNKKLFREWKYQKTQAQKYKADNKLAIDELENYQKHAERLQSQVNTIDSNTLGVNYNDQKYDLYHEMVKEVCQVLKISDKFNLVKSVKAIEQAYQYLPQLQSTTEELYKIISKNNIFNSEISSYEDLTVSVDNWAINLQDYKAQVDGLLNALDINDEEEKTINYIIEQVQQLKRTCDELIQKNNDSKLNDPKDEENFSHICKILGEQDSSKVVDILSNLVKKINYVDQFIDSVKIKLELPDESLDEDVVSSINKVIDIFVEQDQFDDTENYDNSEVPITNYEGDNTHM